MRAFDWFSRRRRREPVPDLREALIAAFSARQYDVMAQLVNENGEIIRKLFPEWRTVPTEVLNDPEALQRYGETLTTIARLFERAGDGSLMRLLSAGNPMAEWVKDMATAQAFVDEGRAADAVTLLKTVLSRLDGMSGSAVQSYRARVLGRLGIALLQVGDRRDAVRVTREALQLCQALGDEEGIRAYTKNLATIGTYEVPANDGTDANVNVAFSDEQGHTLTMDELRTVAGKVKWEVRGGIPVPPEAKRLHQEGRAAGTRGDHDSARALFTRAAELAPSWPYPLYDRAFTHLLQQDFNAALSDYRRTVELAPGGFFTAEVAVDTLTRESTGEFFTGLYAAFVMLEHMPEDQRCSIAAQLVEKYPSFAPGWNEHADCVTDLVKRLEVIENGLAARPDPHTRGFLSVKKAVTMSLLGGADDAVNLLQNLVSTSTSPGVRVMAEFALARLSRSSCGVR